MDGFRDGSGLFGVIGHPEAASVVAHGLGALQHRGEAGFALAASDGQQIRVVRGRGAVTAGAGSDEVLAGGLAIGQVSGGLGDPDLTGLPLDGGDRLIAGSWSGQTTAVALAGRFTNGTRLRRELKARGALFQSESDAELLLHLVAQSSQKTPVNRIVDALWKVEGAFSVLLVGPDLLIAVRDPRGFRPLVMGRLDGALTLATEDAALRDVGATVQRELDPGELLVVERGNVQSVRPFKAAARAACAQELISLARQDATVFQRSPHDVRVDLGARLGRGAPCADADVVVSVPEDEAVGMGYSRATGLPWERGLVAAWRGGPALEPNPVARRAAPAGSHGEVPRWIGVPAAVRGRRVVLVVRSLITGRAVRRAVEALKAAHAVDVHVRFATPAVRKACIYGVPSPTTDELAWTHRSAPDALSGWLDVASVGFLAHEDLRATLGNAGWCTACLTGDQPVLPEEPDDQLPLF